MKSFHSVFALLLLAAMPAFAQDTTSAPSQTSEVYGDWTVECALNDGQHFCAMTQTLVESGSSQHVMTIELARGENGQLEGMLVGPFGMDFSVGVTLSVDAEAIGPALPFLTCLPTGCLIPVSLSDTQRQRLAAGTTLTVTGHSADGITAVPISLSLAGFTAASQRVDQQRD